MTTEEEAVTQAEATGFPVLLKATGGGGGIGIYQCADSADVRTHFAAAQRYLSENCHSLAGKACDALIKASEMLRLITAIYTDIACGFPITTRMGLAHLPNT